MAEENSKRSRPPATTPQGRENQLVSMAMDLAEKQIAAGTASAQVLTHYLKLGTVREQKERLKLEREIELLTAKTESIASAARVEELYADAMKAFKGYRGEEVPEDEEDEVF